MLRFPFIISTCLFLWVSIFLNKVDAGEVVKSLGEVKNKIGSETGRTLPRYATLKSSVVNMRRGPGKEFKVDWVYHRKHLPVKIVLEYSRWRKIVDFEGYSGWVHASLLSGKKSLIVVGENIPLRKKPDNSASPTAYLQKRLLVFPKLCEGQWCKVEVNDYVGWVRTDMIWGDTH